MTNATTPVARIQRTIHASPERVFDAWLDPKALAQFMRPGPTMTCDAVNDPRVGGKYLITMLGDNGVFPHTGEYLELDRPRRIVFSWHSKGTAMAASTVTVELKPAKSGATELTLTHVGLPEPTVGDHAQGWTKIVELLEGVVKA
jgi:glutathione S-transferase